MSSDSTQQATSATLNQQPHHQHQPPQQQYDNRLPLVIQQPSPTSQPAVDLLSSLSNAAASASPIKPNIQPPFTYTSHVYQPLDSDILQQHQHNTNNNDNDYDMLEQQPSDNQDTTPSLNDSNYRPRQKRSTITHLPKHATTGVAKHTSYDTLGNPITTTKVYLICRHDCGCKRRGSDIHLLAAPRACSSRGARHDQYVI